MLRQAFPIATIIGATLILMGCTSTSSVPIEDAYIAPTGTDVATIKGSIVSQGGLFGDVHRGYVIMVDLKAIADPSDRINDPITLAPGRHIIAAEYRYSNFMARAYLPLEAQRGVSYQLMISNGHEDIKDGRPTSDFWIVNATTGKSVTQVYRRQASGGKKGTVFNVNK